MENPVNNKKTAEVFSRYIEHELGKKSQVVLPKNPTEPEFDVRLDFEEGKSLFLQLKQLIKFEGVFTGTKVKGKIFGIHSVESVIQKAEIKYKDKAKNLILILHINDDCGYSILSDTEVISVENFNSSNFKGIYIVSPEHELWGESGQEVLPEFVFKIKNAFL